MTTITEVELQAFVDDELDGSDRIKVIDHLLADRGACTRTLLDLRGREAMRLLDGHDPVPSGQTLALASRLAQRAGRRDRWWRVPAAGTALVAAALALAVSIGVIERPSSRAEPAPRYLEEALESQQAAFVRRRMVSQLETSVLDSRDLRAATRIRVPVLPTGWRITDAQVFPSDFGPALQLTIRTTDGKSLSLFATHALTGAPTRPTVSRVDRQSMAAWEMAGNTYVLAGGLSPTPLLDVADDLADNRLA